MLCHSCPRLAPILSDIFCAKVWEVRVFVPKHSSPDFSPVEGKQTVGKSTSQEEPQDSECTQSTLNVFRPECRGQIEVAEVGEGMLAACCIRLDVAVAGR